MNIHSAARLAGSFLLASLVLGAAPAAAQCTAPWQHYTVASPPSFGAGINGTKVWDLGGGGAPDLLVGGIFSSINGTPVNNVARLDTASQTWSGFGTGPGQVALGHVVLDVSGAPTGNVAACGFAGVFGAGTIGRVDVWDGATWSTLPLFTGGTTLPASIEYLPNGDIVVTGNFTHAGGVLVNNIARWDGSTWNAMGGGFGAELDGMTVLPNGDLVVGTPLLAGGSPSPSPLSSWNGSTWTGFGTPTNSFIGSINDLEDLPNGDLVASGAFLWLPAIDLTATALWDGTNWVRLAGAPCAPATMIADGPCGATLTITALPGGDLMAAGFFDTADGAPANNVARWDGSNWTAVGAGLGAGSPAQVFSLTAMPNGEVYAGGSFPTTNLARIGCGSTPPDCDGDGISDADEIAGGSLDLNMNGIPDECEGPPSFCNGDGGDQMGCTDCPCMNNAAPGTIGGCLNSAGSSARLMATGDTSVSLPSGSMSDLRFSLSGAPANAFCILNSGDGLAPGNMANPCFGLNTGGLSSFFDGLRCAIMNTRRHGGRSADGSGDVGTTNSPWGGEGGPPVGIAIAGGGFAAGQTRHFQAINRDNPALSCMRALNTSQAIEITFTP